MEFVTLTKADPDFKKYLWGSFASDKRATTVETFHVDSPRERVTFKIQSVSDVKKPSWWKIYLISARPEMWLLSLGPALSTLLVAKVWDNADRLFVSALALLALFFLHNSACLLNDVMDHIHGTDRANRRRGSQVIQKGWSTAQNMLRWALFNFALAVLLAIPAVLSQPTPLLLVGILAVSSISIMLSAKGARYGLADASVVILYGPLIVTGMSLVQGLSISRDLILIALNFGWMSMWVLQARQIENLFRSQKEGNRSFLGYLPFDLAKKSFLIEGIATIVFVVVSSYKLEIPWLAWIALVPLIFPMFFVLIKLQRAASPLSSDFIKVGRWALFAHGSLAIWWWLALGLR